MTNVLHYLWIGYTVFTVLSFLWFSRIWARSPKSWHIGMMSMSYAASVLYISMRMPIKEINWMLLGVIFVTGNVGLFQYWKWQFDLWRLQRAIRGERYRA
jgi:hypothetical protein